MAQQPVYYSFQSQASPASATPIAQYVGMTPMTPCLPLSQPSHHPVAHHNAVASAYSPQMGVGYVPAPPPPCFTPPAKTPERPAPSPLPFDIVGHYLGEMGLEDTPERRYETWDRIGRIIERKIKEREEAAKRANAPVADGPYTYVAQQTHTTPGAFVPHQVQTFAQTFTGGNRQQQLYRQDTFTAISEHHTSAASSAADYSPLVPTLG